MCNFILRSDAARDNLPLAVEDVVDNLIDFKPKNKSATLSVYMCNAPITGEPAFVLDASNSIFALRYHEDAETWWLFIKKPRTNPGNAGVLIEGGDVTDRIRKAIMATLDKN